MGYDLQGVKFLIFLFILAWALQQWFTRIVTTADIHSSTTTRQVINKKFQPYKLGS